MTMTKMDKIREHYDNHDTSEDLASAFEAGTVVEEGDTADDPMITTSLRLPRSVLQAVRQRAAAEGIKPTALMRRIIETSVRPPLSRSETDPVAELHHVIESATRALRSLENHDAA